MRRWGQITDEKSDEWYAATAKSVYLPDVYLEAARLLVADGRAKESDFPWTSDGYRAPTADFLDGVAYDGRRPNAYLENLAIGLKGDDTPSTVQATSTERGLR
jgi:nitrate/nitrite transport system substrate-binding protein